MTTRVRNLKIGDRFTLARTGDRYEFLGHKRDTPSGTLYVARRKGFAAPTTLHHSCHVILDGEPMANQAKTSGSPLATRNVAVATPDVASYQTKGEA